jgi:predicted transposase YbfD/YdcC
VGEQKLTLGEVAVAEKSKANTEGIGTITAVPELLKLLDIKGNVITADAMCCPKKTAKKIRER